jgi:hypothetical protein
LPVPVRSTGNPPKWNVSGLSEFEKRNGELAGTRCRCGLRKDWIRDR